MVRDGILGNRGYSIQTNGKVIKEGRSDHRFQNKESFLFFIGNKSKVNPKSKKKQQKKKTKTRRKIRIKKDKKKKKEIEKKKKVKKNWISC